jgi:PHP family Zn ribbon phosphoesterase
VEIKGEKVFERKRSDSPNETRQKKATEYKGGGGEDGVIERRKQKLTKEKEDN